jgi:hypothetical protein
VLFLVREASFRSASRQVRNDSFSRKEFFEVLCMASAASLSLFPYEHTLRYRKIFMANIRGKVYERDMKEADWERGATFFTGNLTIVSKPILSQHIIL